MSKDTFFCVFGLYFMAMATYITVGQGGGKVVFAEYSPAKVHEGRKENQIE